MLIQPSNRLNEKSREQILGFCRHIAGSCQVTSACICGDHALALSNEKATMEILLIIHDFQPRLMNYVHVFDGKNAIFSAVDEWVFERDVDRGFLGEALAGELIFPYIPLLNKKYLDKQEVKLKKRLILELLQNLALNFPELSYNFHIQPEYFMYETMLSRARLFPPTIHSLMNFMQEDVKRENAKRVLNGYLEALKELKQENIVSFSKGYVRISRKFVEDAKNRKVRFTNLFKTAQRALFTSLLGIFPKSFNLISQNAEALLRFQNATEEKSEIIHQIEDPQTYLYVPTASGLVSLTNRMDIEAFSRKVLSADEDAKIEIEEIGGILNDVYLITVAANGEERKIVVKRFKDWSSFKWFPLTLWTVGTKSFAVSGRSRLERECTINQILYSEFFSVPKVLHVSHSERLIFMDYVEGENFDSLVKKIVNSKISGETAKDLAAITRVGETFAKVHALGIALGDTKPENIMIGKNGEVVLLDFEQASRNGDKVWDVAEFLYYAGHDVSPFVGTHSAELVSKAFIEGYLKAGGDPKIVREAGNPKYTKVFSVFTFPHIMFAISNVCRNAGKRK
jgi:tRNA A-37 threonylcarbamoyl transferase component Bud32